MKYSILSAALLSLTTLTAYANNAPALRGEYQPMPAPSFINISQTPIQNLPTPTLHISDVKSLSTILIPQTTEQNSALLDVTLIDDFIDDISPNARHYPPNFPNRTALHLTRENIKYLSTWLEPYAGDTKASFEVLMRAAKINSMAKNLDLGSEYSVNAGKYLLQALKLQPDHAEANFLYGMMLSESGGFKEGGKYLEKAASLGYLEAEQSIAQAELLADDRASALSRLEQLASRYPNHAQLAQQINIVQNGGYYIWDIKDNNINVKPLP